MSLVVTKRGLSFDNRFTMSFGVKLLFAFRITYAVVTIEPHHEKSNRKVMNMNWSNQKSNPALKTKMGKKIKITNRQKTMRTYGQPSGQLFPKRWPLSNPYQTKSIMNKHKVKHHRNSDSKTGN